MDDDAIARRAVRNRLQEDGIVVVAEAAGGRKGVELALHYRPDVVVMDLVMPEVDVLAATQQIVDKAGEVKVVMLTPSQSEQLGLMALRAGASGYVSKSVGLDGLTCGRSSTTPVARLPLPPVHERGQRRDRHRRRQLARAEHVDGPRGPLRRHGRPPAAVRPRLRRRPTSSSR